MITMITAVPGSGKTLYSISLIESALISGRSVYTNIQGLDKSKFSNSGNLYDAPNDWTLCPDGSYIVYDEAQGIGLYPADAKMGLVSDTRLKAMETHRHRGIDLVFITQSPTLIHHHIRKLVGEHIHFYRARGVRGAAKYTWSHAVSSPNDRNEQRRADVVIWKFPKKYFSYYKSAVIHTHKFKFPYKIVVLFSFILISFCFIIYRVYAYGGLAIFSSLGG